MRLREQPPLLCGGGKLEHSHVKMDPVPEARRPRCQTSSLFSTLMKPYEQIELASHPLTLDFYFFFIYILVTHKICRSCIVILTHLTLIVGDGWTRGLSDTLNPISALHTTSSSPSHHHLPPPPRLLASLLSLGDCPAQNKHQQLALSLWQLLRMLNSGAWTEEQVGRRVGKWELGYF